MNHPDPFAGINAGVIAFTIAMTLFAAGLFLLAALT